MCLIKIRPAPRDDVHSDSERPTRIVVRQPRQQPAKTGQDRDRRTAAVPSSAPRRSASRSQAGSRSGLSERRGSRDGRGSGLGVGGASGPARRSATYSRSSRSSREIVIVRSVSTGRRRADGERISREVVISRPVAGSSTNVARDSNREGGRDEGIIIRDAEPSRAQRAWLSGGGGGGADQRASREGVVTRPISSYRASRDLDQTSNVSGPGRVSREVVITQSQAPSRHSQSFQRLDPPLSPKSQHSETRSSTSRVVIQQDSTEGIRKQQGSTSPRPNAGPAESSVLPSPPASPTIKIVRVPSTRASTGGASQSGRRSQREIIEVVYSPDPADEEGQSSRSRSRSKSKTKSRGNSSSRSVSVHDNRERRSNGSFDNPNASSAISAHGPGERRLEGRHRQGSWERTRPPSIPRTGSWERIRPEPSPGSDERADETDEKVWIQGEHEMVTMPSERKNVQNAPRRVSFKDDMKPTVEEEKVAIED